MQKNTPIVRACDVGYGHVKWTEGRDPTGLILADCFPSQAPVATEGEFKASEMEQRDTFVVPVGGRNYEVGRKVRLAIGANQELEQLDSQFALSDGYAARLYGTFNYMLPTLPSRTIDFLMLGLPLTTLNRHSEALSNRYIGEHIINLKGGTITVSNCAVYPQPLGGYAAYLQRPLARHTAAPLALIVDIGYNTVDWLTCEGMVANPTQASAVERGMNAYLREVAKSIIKTANVDGSESAIVRRLDQQMIKGGEFSIAGQPFDLAPHLQAGDSILEQAAQAVRNYVGAGLEIDVIIVSGGGAKLYAPWLKMKFATHEVVTLPAPALANVRGFHQFGEWIAASAQRALNTAATQVANK